jgi:hypothetical protein
METTTWNKEKELKNKWWHEKRGKYNLGLIISGILAFILYALVIEFIVPFDTDVEITLFTIIFQGIGYLVMMGIANLLYNLGAYSEKIIKPKNIDKYRKQTFNLGFWFSCGLPFLIPLVLLITNL